MPQRGARVQTVNVALGERSYTIRIGAGLLAGLASLGDLFPGRSAAVVTNETVAPLYLQTVTAALSRGGVRVASIVLPDGEAHKNWHTLNLIFDRLLEARCERNTVVVALGGGVIGDLAGFAAAVYLRGVPLMQLPTTLLAQVDSSVGGKTAINHPLGKNLIGAFHQPIAVLADTDTLRSLSVREMRAGLAEVIKHGLIGDAAFFAWLESSLEPLLEGDPGAMAHAIRRCCEIKAGVVGRDERESGERAVLNFGHTFGHAIENEKGYGAWLHGEAVAAGMAMAADLSVRAGRITAIDRDRVIGLLRRAGLPAGVDGISVERFHELLGLDKKVSGGRVRFVLLDRIGHAAFGAEVTPSDLDHAITAAAARAAA